MLKCKTERIMKLIKINANSAVNPKHVIGLTLNNKTLVTVVILLGGLTVPSDYTLEETMKLLTENS